MTAPRLQTRSSWWLPFLIAGVACVVIGGLLAAATAYVTTQKTAWATAYIVLVGGVAQVGLGGAVAWLRPRAPRRLAWETWTAWNLGNAGVIAGQLAGLIVLTDIGTVILVVALALILIAVSSKRYANPDAGDDHRGVLFAFRGLVVLLAVSMPIGIILAHVGA